MAVDDAVANIAEANHGVEQIFGYPALSEEIHAIPPGRSGARRRASLPKDLPELRLHLSCKRHQGRLRRRTCLNQDLACDVIDFPLNVRQPGETVFFLRRRARHHGMRLWQSLGLLLQLVQLCFQFKLLSEELSLL